jgi:hypothetical protein
VIIARTSRDNADWINICFNVEGFKMATGDTSLARSEKCLLFGLQ